MQTIKDAEKNFGNYLHDENYSFAGLISSHAYAGNYAAYDYLSYRGLIVSGGFGQDVRSL